MKNRILWPLLLVISLITGFITSSSGNSTVEAPAQSALDLQTNTASTPSVVAPLSSNNALQAATATNNANQTNNDNNATKTAEPNSENNQPNKPAQLKRLWNLENADIQAVIAAVSKETGKNFIVDPRVTGKITIVSSAPMAADEVYQLFQSILQVLGYAAVPSKDGRTIKIVPDMSAREMAAPLDKSGQASAGDELVAEVIPLRTASANQLVPILRPLMSQWSTISAYTPNNTLILVGRAATLAHIIDIVKQMDQTDTSQIEVIPLKYAAADKIVTAFTTLQSSDRALGKVSNVSVAADPQSNSVLISGNLENRILLHHLIEQLDTKRASGPTGNTVVIHLKYLKAKDLATMLGKVSQSSFVDSNTNPGMGQQNTSTNKNVSIQAEESTNSVVISAPAEIMSTLRSVVAQLDSRPRQVLVKAIIAEVTETTARSLGVKWGYFGSTNNVNTTNNGINTSTVSDSSVPDLSSFEQGIGFIPHGDLSLIISALQTDNSANILSTPSVMVMDNQEATLSNGTEISEANRQYGEASTGMQDQSLQPFNTVQRRNVALVLKVTPHISPNNSVSLQIEQDNDSLANPGESQNLYPKINTSKIKTAVLISSGDVLVLGGLTRQQLQEEVQRTPILSDIPVVGNLFKQRNKTIEKKNLLVFIKPVIISSEGQGNAISNQNYEYIRNKQLQKRHGESFIATENPSPLLPARPQKLEKLPKPF